MRYLLNNNITTIHEEIPDGVQGIEILSLEEFKNKEETHLHRRQFLHNVENIRYCKTETYGDCIFGTLSIPVKHHLLEEKQAFSFYIEKNRIYFIDSGKTVHSMIEKMKDIQYGEHTSVLGFFIVFLEFLIRDDVLYLQTVEEKLSTIEEALLTKIPEDFYKTIMRCRKEILALHTYYEQLIDVGESLQADTGDMFEDFEHRSFERFTNRVNHLHDHVEMLREYIIQIREMYQSQLDINQNRSMNLLTVVTTIFFPLSIIVGWYGMNFTFMPELTWKYGYIFVVILSMAVIFFELRFFKKKKII